MKPTIFFGSSTECESIVKSLIDLLKEDADCHNWRTIFPLSSTTFNSLNDELGTADFAVFVYGFEDLFYKHGTNRSEHVTRDNVVFEHGLFAGGIGKERCFIVKPRLKVNTHIPSDVQEITYAEFTSTGKPMSEKEFYSLMNDEKALTEALKPAAEKIKECLHNPSLQRIDLSGIWLQIHVKKDIRVGFAEFKQKQDQITVSGTNVKPDGQSGKDRITNWSYSKCFLETRGRQTTLVGLYDADSADRMTTHDGVHILDRMDDPVRPTEMSGRFQNILASAEINHLNTIDNHAGTLFFFRPSEEVISYLDRDPKGKEHAIKLLHTEPAFSNEPYVKKLLNIINERTNNDPS